LKDELAGKKVRCPGCSGVVAVPDVEEPEEEAIVEAPRARPAPPPPRPAPAAPRYRGRDDEDEDEDEDEDDEEDSSPRRRPLTVKKRKTRAKLHNGGHGGGMAVNGSVLGGLAMMVGALVWFFVGLAAGYIFFYPPVLFVLGIVALVKGLAGN
jgi:hypothetical protein